MADPSIRELLADSKLAFTGTVESAGATSVPALPADERTVIARVGEVLHAPPQVDLAPGGTVTVQLSPELPPLTPGSEATFFANAVAYGDDLAVAEVGRTTPEDAAAPTARLAGVPSGVTPVRAAVAALAEQEVVEHARSADAVIRAQVVALRVVPPTGPPHEHDPLWWVATLRHRCRRQGRHRPGRRRRGPLRQQPRRQGGATGPSRRRVRAACGCCTGPPIQRSRSRLPSSSLTRSTCRPACCSTSVRARGSAMTLQIVNMIPKSLSGEAEQDCEPNIAVNPENPQQIVGHRVHARPDERDHAPVYVSSDGGRDLVAALDRPGRPRHGRTSRVGFGSRGGALYAGHPQLHDHEPERPAHRQPVRADADDRARRPPGGGPAVGQRDDRARRQRRQGPGLHRAQRLQRPARRLRRSSSRATPAAVRAPARLRDRKRSRRRATVGQDGPPVRTGRARRRHGLRRLPALDQAAAFRHQRPQRWTSWSSATTTAARGATPFRDLVDGNDGKPGVRVANDRFIRFTASVGPLGQERIGADLAVAVDPHELGRTSGSPGAIGSAAPAGTDWTMHVRAVDRPRPDLVQPRPAHGHERQEPRARGQRTAGSWRSCSSSSSAPEPPRGGSPSSS